MRILEKSEDVLTLQNSATEFWFINIYLMISFPLIMVLFAAYIIEWGQMYLLSAIGFLFALINILANNKIKVCSFDKALSKVTVKYYGLLVKTKNFPIQNVRAVEVRKNIVAAYGVVRENYNLVLLTENFGIIYLSQSYSSEAIANQVQKFLNLSSRSM